MAVCKSCGIFFHYPVGPRGEAVKGGVWSQGIWMPCVGITLSDVGFLLQSGWGSFSFAGATILFSEYLNNFATVGTILFDELQDESALVDVQLLGQALFTANATVINVTQGPADMWYIACLDQPPQEGLNCPPGEYYDPLSESCKPLGTGQIIPPPPPPTCPPGTTWDPVSMTCKPTSTNPPPPPPTCLPGFHWDDQLEQCIPDTIVPQPCQPVDDPSDDELAQDMNCLNRNLLYLQYQISQLLPGGSGGGGGGGNLDPVTCAQLTGLIASVNLALLAIGKAITAAASSSSTPTDLSAIVAQLTKLASTLSSVTIPTGPAVNVNLTSSTPLATATATAPSTDVSAIVDQLKQVVFQGDVPQATLDALQQLGFINGDDLQQLQGAPWSKVLAWIESTKLWRSFERYERHAGIDPARLSPDLIAGKPAPGDWPIDQIKAAMTTERNFIQDIISPILAAVRAQLKPPGATTIDVIGVDPDKVLADVAAVSLNMELLSVLVGLIFPGAAEQLRKITEISGGLLGLEELREVQLGPLVRFGIGRVAEMQAKATYKQEIPDTGSLFDLVAQGLLAEVRARAVAQFNGTPDELVPAIAASRFRGLNPRQMLRLIETGLFSGADIADELTFAAMRPVSQHRMLLAAPYLATASERSSLRATIENAATAGLLSDSDVTSQLDAAESNTDRDSLILAKVHLQQLVAETKALELEYSALYKAGLISDETFRANLAAIGLQPFAVNMVAAKAEVAANVTMQRKTLAAEAALERATENKARAAAMKGFIDGTIDEAGLAAGLTATGLTPLQTAAWVSLARLQKGGGLRWLYGLQLSPSQAILLRERVGALTDQRKRQLITDSDFVAALQALQLGPRYINALRAAADAMLSPKTAAIAVPVETG